MAEARLIRRVGVNTGFVLGSEVVRRLLAFALQLLAVRVFGDAGYGRYTFAIGFVTLWALGNDLGLAELTVRDVAREKARAAAYLADVLSMKLLAGVLVLGVLALVGGSTQPDELAMILWAGLSVVIFAGSRESALGVFKGTQDFRSLFIVNLAGDVLTLGLGYAAVLAGYGPLGLIVATAAATLLSSLFSLLWARKRFGAARPDPRRWWGLLKAGFPFALASVFIIVYKLVDVTMLKYMLGSDEVVGWYGASVKLINILLFAPMALSAALFPALSEMKGDDVRLARTASLTIRLLVGLALPAAILIFFHAERISAIALGPGYGPSADSLRVLALSLPLVFASYPLSVLLKSTGREKLFAAGAAVSGLVNVAANLYAIPRWEHVGAAWTTVISEALVLVLFIVFARRYIDLSQLGRPLLGTLAAGAAYGTACAFLSLWWSLALLPVYVLLLFVTGAVKGGDIRGIREGLRRVRHGAGEDGKIGSE
jgi:O-antigen/teichoic acid export membrane protein